MMLINTNSVIYKIILFVSLSIICSSCSHSDAKKDDLQYRFEDAVIMSDWKEMLILANQLLQYKPNDPEVNLRKGHALSELERADEALVFVNKSIEYSTRKYRFLGFTYFIKGNCLKALKRYDEALQSYRLAAKNGYRHKNVYYAGHRMLVKLNRLDKEDF